MLQASRTHSATHNRVRLAQEEGTPEQRYGTESELTSHEDPEDWHAQRPWGRREPTAGPAQSNSPKEEPCVYLTRKEGVIPWGLPGCGGSGQLPADTFLDLSPASSASPLRTQALGAGRLTWGQPPGLSTAERPGDQRVRQLQAGPTAAHISKERASLHFL